MTDDNEWWTRRLADLQAEHRKIAESQDRNRNRLTAEAAEAREASLRVAVEKVRADVDRILNGRYTYHPVVGDALLDVIEDIDTALAAGSVSPGEPEPTEEKR